MHICVDWTSLPLSSVSHATYQDTQGGRPRSNGTAIHPLKSARLSISLSTQSKLCAPPLPDTFAVNPCQDTTVPRNLKSEERAAPYNIASLHLSQTDALVQLSNYCASIKVRIYIETQS